MVIDLVILVLVIGGIYFFTQGDINNYKEYKDFCEDKPNFCYCEWFTCTYKTQWNSLTGLSENTKELCELATKLNDKKTLFDVGCE